MSGATKQRIDGEQRTWERPSVFYRRELKWAFYGLVIAFFAWSIWGLRVPFDRLLLGLDGMVNVLVSMAPPDFSPRNRELIYSGVLESLAMSIVATIAGVAISIPIAFMAARNVAPKPVYVLGRGLVTVSRSFHELIIAIIAVKAFGIGAFAGVFTLVFGTVGFYSKLLAEDIEEIDRSQMDAIRATGAGSFQVLLYGVLPQVMARIVGLTVYRWDINIRVSTVVGIVGAGGIGATLMNSFETYELDFSLAIILVIVLIVLFGEAISAVVRRRVN